MKLSQLTAPSEITEIISSATLQTHLRVESVDELSYIIGLLASARAVAEQYTDRIISQRQFQVLFDSLGSSVELPLYPVDPASIVFTYTDDEDQEQSIPFDFLEIGSALHIVPESPSSWPRVAAKRDRFKVVFNAGYTPERAPEDIKHAVMMIASTLYDQREDHTHVNLSIVPMSSRALLEPYRKAVV